MSMCGFLRQDRQGSYAGGALLGSRSPYRSWQAESRAHRLLERAAADSSEYTPRAQRWALHPSFVLLQLKVDRAKQQRL